MARLINARMCPAMTSGVCAAPLPASPCLSACDEHRTMCSAESAVVFLASDQQALTRHAAVEPVVLVTACVTITEPAATKPAAARAVPFPSPPTPELPRHSPPPSLPSRSPPSRHQRRTLASTLHPHHRTAPRVVAPLAIELSISQLLWQGRPPRSELRRNPP